MSHVGHAPASIEGSPRWWIGTAILAGIAGVLALIVHHHVFPYFSGDLDEPVYRFQAQMLLDGHVTLPASQWQFFRPWLSGPADGHLVLAFPPLWPAVLALTQRSTGAMTAALPLAAVTGVLGVYFLGIELLRHRWAAFLAAAMYAGAPFLLLLNGTYLNYSLSAAAGAWLTLAGIRAVRRDSTGWAVCTGAIFGLLLLLRPFDALIFTLPVLFFAVTQREERRLLRLALVAALAATPFAIATLGYNLVTTGSALEFPTTAQSAGWARFGWGERALSPEFDPVNFTFVKALRGLGRNAAALPTWMFGSYFGVLLAAVGWRSLNLGDRIVGRLLLVMTLTFPLAYLTWWASSLTSAGAFTGLGPHYYVPTLIPLSLLAAQGLTSIANRWTMTGRRRGVAVMLAGLALTTVAFGIPRFRSQLDYTDGVGSYTREVDRAVGRLEGPIVVILARDVHPFVMGEHATLANPPDLATRVRFAIDRGSAAVDLIREQQRPTYRIQSLLTPRDDYSQVAPRLTRQSVSTGSEVVLHTTITNTSGGSVVTAYARYHGKRVARVIDRNSSKGTR